METNRSLEDFQDPLDLLAAVSATKPSAPDPINEKKRKGAARKKMERHKRQKEDKKKEHQQRKEDYLANLQRDRYMPRGTFESIVDLVAEHQKNKDMKEIGKLLNRCTEIRKVLTLPGDRKKPDGGDDDASNKSAAWFFKTHRGRGKNTMTIPPHVVIAEEWEIHFDGRHLFTIKRSTLSDAGYGLFFAQNVRQGRCVGLAHGKPKSLNEKKTSNYAWKSESLGFIIDPGGSVSDRRQTFPIYLGIHLANDPGLKVDKDGCLTRKRSVEIQNYNITVAPDLWVYTLRDVRKGEEAFLNYAWEGCPVTEIPFRANPRY